MQVNNSALWACALLAATILVGSATAHATLLEDGAFTPLTQTMIYTSTGNSATIDIPCTDTCGNGGGAGIEVLVSAASQAIFVGEPNWVLDPAGIGFLSGSIDRLTNFTGRTTDVLRLAIEQAGNFYFTDLAGDSITQVPSGTVQPGIYYNLVSGPLGLDSFGAYQAGSIVPGSAHPTPTAGPIDLGYMLLVTGSETNNITSVDFDNLSFDVTTVPEPASLPLFGTGIGALCILYMRKKKKGEQVSA